MSTAMLRDGSSLYYSLLYSGDEERRKALAALSLVKTISLTLNDVTEPTVAEKKIHWWHEEIDRLANNTARHPDCIAVQQLLDGKHCADALLDILSAAATERYHNFSRLDELQAELLKDYGARVQLFNYALTETSTPQTLPKTALGFAHTDRLANLGYRLANDYAVFSDDVYAEHGIEASDLYDTEAAKIDATSQAVASLLNAQIQQARQCLLEAVTEQATLTNEQVPLALRILTQMRLRQSQLWLKRNAQLHRESMTMTPFKKLFVAYRTARQWKRR